MTAAVDALRAAPAHDRARELRRLVLDAATGVLTDAGRAPSVPLDAARPFRAQGVDSLAAIALADRLSADLGVALPPSSAFDHPTPAALADELATVLFGAAPVTPDAPARRRTDDDDPVAIVAMACRYPGGVAGPDELWRVVADELDVIGDLPTDRGWDLAALHSADPDAPGTSYVSRGGFLYDAADFDPAFFGISPREALAMDPQQRLMLEIAWEALERAGIDPDSVRGPGTGVFVGAEPQDYGPRLQDAPDGLEGHLLTGNAPSVVSGRIAYALGLEGPTLTVDTACSGSLVALHLAVSALRAGDCDLALAGGVAVMSTPGTFTAFSRQRGLAPDGRCKPFAAAADGTAWGEGAGVLLVERLSDARRHGHPVLALVRGSAINSDGASNGLTAPNGPSQRRVITAALAAAGLAPADVDALEAHGTGTPLGDPIEAQAVIAGYGVADRSAPLYLGSLKSNIGHTQAAAGVGGVIKMVQAMTHGRLPRSLHVDAPTPHVDWSGGRVALLTEARDWPALDRPRRAGVSSFGISGTNAHVVLEAAPAVDAAPAGRPGVGFTALSARSDAALRSHARRVADHLDAGADSAAVAAALAQRARLEHRAVVLGAPDAQAAGLRAIAAGADHPDVVRGEVVPGELAVLFPGQGAQRLGMGRELYDTEPVFRAAFDAACAELDLQLDRPLREVVHGTDLDLLDETGWTQPAVFALEVALFRLVESWGVVPDIVGGHSIGELAAAHVAGVLSLADAALLVGARARLMQALPAGGAMVAVRAGEAEVRDALVPGADIAAVNGPSSVVVAGDEDAVAQVAARFEQSRRLRVSHAFHSPRMAPMLAEFAELAELLDYHPPRLSFVSALTGTFAGTEVATAGYWVRHVREAVRFADVAAELERAGVATVVELGPDATLSTMLGECGDLVAVPVLRRDAPEHDSVRAAVARLFVRGAGVDVALLAGRTSAPDPALPTYPFQRERYWLDAGRASAPAAAGVRDAHHPLLDAVVELAGSGLLLTGRLGADSHPWLADHAIAGQVLLPGTAFVELALQAARHTGCDTVEELTLQAPLVLAPGRPVTVQVHVAPADDDDRRAIEIHSRHDEGPWTPHAAGTLVAAAAAVAPAPAWPPPAAAAIDLAGRYERLADQGYGYGPTFRGLRHAWHDGDDVLAEVVLPTDADDADGFGLHPAVLDAVLHAADLDASDGPPELPFAWTGVTLFGTGATTVRARLRRSAGGLRVELFDAAGAAVAVVGSLVSRPFTAPAQRGDGALYDVVHRPVPTPVAAPGRGVRLDLDPAGPLAALDALTAGITAGAMPPDHALARPADADAALALLQHWLAVAPLAATTLVLAVPGADLDPRLAAVAGLARAAQEEHPGRVVLADLDPDSAADLALLPAAVASGEPEFTVRDATPTVPRLRALDAATTDAAGDGPAWPTAPGDGTVVITGGTGGLGLLVARHLVAHHGVRDLLLLSRRGAAAPGVDDALADLREAGATVRALACDVADAAQLRAALDSCAVGAVVHAAGVLDDGVLESLTPDRLAAVRAVKADAATVLDEYTRVHPVRAFVLFSSAAATLDGAGQGNYAAANAALEALARRRHADGLPATAIAWTLWSDPSGMAGRLTDADVQRVRAGGLPPLDTADGLRLLDAAVASAAPVVHALRLDPAALRRRPAGVPAVLQGLVRPDVRRAARAAASPTGLRGELAGLDAATRAERVRAVVREQVAASLGHASAEAVDLGRAFAALGLDSLAAVDLRNRLNAVTGLRLPATTVFDHPSPAALARHLDDELGGAEAAAAPATVAPAGTSDDDPVVIVGVACRYPGGVRSADDLWRLVVDGVDAVSDFPTDRGWDVAALYDPEPGLVDRTYCVQGGFLDGAGGAADFDADFFGVSPREARAMDPQQRLLLEATWEALEHAGIDPDALRGTATGVYSGVMYHDFAARLREIPDELKGYLGNGSLGSVVSGRIAYTFGLEGPAVTVDTACSSSLVALHLAAQAVRAGECTLALVGGVTVMTTADTFTDFALQRGLATDGRCKAFAAGADGTGWGEGVGVLVVERLSAAHAAGHDVLAVVRGTAINQDGASNGLTAPNGPAQQRVIRAALASAGLAATDVDAVEGHGTGTALGDPIEAQALLATYGQHRDTPLYLGSLKSNLGHTQAAAGVGGVIKMVQAMRHGVLPATLHVDAPSPAVDWSAGSVELITANRAWPDTGRPRRAAVSSFGISGTNAHVVLEAADPLPVAALDGTAGTEAPLAWLLSARTATAVHALAAELPAVTAAADDIAHSLAGRATFGRRAAVVGATRAELLTGLADLTVETAAPGPVGVLFTGQGAQRAGMGRTLYERVPAYRDHFDRVCAALDPHLPMPLAQVVFDDTTGLIDRTEFAQPVLFALGTALFRTLADRGLAPAVVAGHSVGEITAAHVAGVLDLASAARLVAVRGRLMQALPAGGAMLAVAAGEHDLTVPAALDVAAVNSPTSTVLSGPAAAIDAFADVCAADGVRTKRLTVSHAFHSRLMEPMLAEFEAALADVEFHPATIDVVSDVTGAVTDVGSAAYWAGHVRAAVRFADTVETMVARGVTTLVEIGPDAVLTAMAAETVGDGVALVPVLQRRRDDDVALLAALARLWTLGVDVDVPTPGHRVPLPTYRFDHEHYWLPVGRSAGDLVHTGQRPDDHPLLAARVDVPGGAVHTGVLSLRTTPWLGEHRVHGAVLLPGAALLDLVLHAGSVAGHPTVDELVLQEPLTVPEQGEVELRVVLDAGRVAVASRPAGSDATWTLHATGSVSDAAVAPVPIAADVTGTVVDVDARYDALAASGLGYGPTFTGLTAARFAGDVVHAEVALPADCPVDGFGVHPALLDAALHALGLSDGDTGRAELPFSFTGVALHRPGATAARVQILDRRVQLTAADGTPVLTIGEVALRELAAPAAPPLLRIEWQPVPAASGAPIACEVLALPSGPDLVDTATATLTALQGALSSDDDRPLVVLTRHAVAVDDAEPIADLPAAAARGLVRAAQAESSRRIVLLDTADTGPVDAVLAAAGTETELAVRGTTLYAPRLVPLTGPAEPVAPTGPVLVTGGTGGLGALVARRLVTDHGVTELVLVSRRGTAAPGVDALTAGLTELGAGVTVVAGDVADRDAVRELLDAHRPGTIVHAAGVLDDATLASMTTDQVRAVLRPKAVAAAHLAEFAGDAALVLFSSVAGSIDAAAQGNYAAANCFLDALAHTHRRSGHRAVSIAWALWDGPGMGAGLDDLARARVARSGLPPLTVDEGLALFDAALTTDVPPMVVAARTDPAALAALGEPVSVWRALVRPRSVSRTAAIPGPDVADLDALPATERFDRLVELVTAQVVPVLGYADASAVDIDRGFGEMGVDSLAAVELRNRIVPLTGVKLPATTTFDYPTVRALARHLDEIVAARASATITVGSADDELNRLEAALSASSVGDAAAHTRVADRLRALTATWLARSAPAPAADDLSGASAEDLFDILDGEFENLAD